MNSLLYNHFYSEISTKKWETIIFIELYITEISLKVALNTIILSQSYPELWLFLIFCGCSVVNRYIMVNRYIVICWKSISSKLFKNFTNFWFRIVCDCHHMKLCLSKYICMPEYMKFLWLCLILS